MKKTEEICKMAISITILITIFISCSLRECSPLERKIKTICIKADTVYQFPLNSLTDFDWTELYIFSGPRAPIEVEKIIGIKYDKIIKDNHRQFIFIKNNNIVKDYSSSCRDVDLYWTLDKERKGYTKYSNTSVLNIKTELQGGKRLYLSSIPM